MANPFLTIAAVILGIITAGYGMLQVPGWVASAQDGSANNDIAQVSIGQAASLSITGKVQANVAAINAADLGVQVSVESEADELFVVTSATNDKAYAVIVESESGNVFYRVNGEKILPAADLAAAATAVAAIDASLTVGAPTP